MRDLIQRALAEDVGEGDLTSRAVVPEGSRASGAVIAKAEGVVAGLPVAEAVFEAVDGGLELETHAIDGDRVGPGTELLSVRGDARSILAAERVALNLLGRLSGVATLTARYVAAVAGTGARILDTRKTTPGMRALEKAAVVAGGGSSHRFGLYDAVLVKENHVRVAGGVGEATRRALVGAPAGVSVEVEVESLAELEAALEAGVGRVLLDNMSLVDLRAAVELASGRAQLEASGGIGLESVGAVAETGVDFISVGALTHSAPALDVSLLFEPESAG
ncbi:MAG TPA: carboxylating nicotinate-nucleotide diphosphorylase [Thermoleophilaceae bacterium]|nr:carboxylating nicotinate-nucleotide diphosphorylase [Thermoleophilaceae bacterium]